MILCDFLDERGGRTTSARRRGGPGRLLLEGGQPAVCCTEYNVFLHLEGGRARDTQPWRGQPEDDGGGRGVLGRRRVGTDLECAMDACIFHVYYTPSLFASQATHPVERFFWGINRLMRNASKCRSTLCSKCKVASPALRATSEKLSPRKYRANRT